jgi:FeS assembly protein IscX
MSIAKPLKWTDTLDIALALVEEHPEVDVQHLRFTDLHRWVTELDGFVDDPQKSNEKILEAIQMAWLDELDG